MDSDQELIQIITEHPIFIFVFTIIFLVGMFCGYWRARKKYKGVSLIDAEEFLSDGYLYRCCEVFVSNETRTSSNYILALAPASLNDIFEKPYSPRIYYVICHSIFPISWENSNPKVGAIYEVSKIGDKVTMQLKLTYEQRLKSYSASIEKGADDV